MATMDDIKSFASLTSGLLARKGAARPAMRPQVVPGQQGAAALAAVACDDDEDLLDTELAAAQADLGWNDHGEHDAPQGEEADRPEVLRQRDDLEAGVLDTGVAANDEEAEEDAPEATAQGAPIHLTPMSAPGDRTVRNEFDGSRRAAFTLRVDRERHLLLRLACTLQNRSAQQVVTEALDKLLEEMPGLADLARRARRH